jgi:hypothetical protein
MYNSGTKIRVCQPLSGDGPTQNCQIFLGTWYLNVKKCTKWIQNVPNGHKNKKSPWNIPNGHKIYRHFSIQGPPTFTQIGIFGLKTNHLATLVQPLLFAAPVSHNLQLYRYIYKGVMFCQGDQGPMLWFFEIFSPKIGVFCSKQN